MRREEHLRNVIACVEMVSASLAATSAQLLADYQSRTQELSALEGQYQVIGDIDHAALAADKIMQATRTLKYESEQFRIPDLWHLASLPRQKVLELREKVFGTGARRPRSGHGRFNRVQWALDGNERAVDTRGRTESEDEEERRIDPEGEFMWQDHLGEEDEDVDVIQHPGMRPIWLLRFFTSWGRWRRGAQEPEDRASEASARTQARSSLIRHFTFSARFQWTVERSLFNFL
ncbi:hypothetical protein FISHEDRAFT_65270 [Fistulina hepatica ATCC 64428]|nr:hypothetical protein FISHEDRAFT_65270 [Fistulina hepatica ATCC 64428]